MGNVVDVQKIVLNKKRELQIILHQILTEFHNIHHISYPDLWQAFLQLESKLGTKFGVFEFPSTFLPEQTMELKHYILSQNITTINHLTQVMKLFQISYKVEIKHQQIKFETPDEVLQTLITNEDITIQNIPITELINLYLVYYDFVSVNFVNPMFEILNNKGINTELPSLDYKINVICKFLSANQLKKEIFFICKYMNEKLRNAFLKNRYFVNDGGITYIEFDYGTLEYVDHTISLTEFSHMMLSVIFSRVILTNIINLRISEITLEEFVQYLDILINE